MQNLFNLFKILHITRDQPQYGYNVAGLHKYEQSDLAQHHYLVTFITWQLCHSIIAANGKINTERAMKIAMVHDLGELFGGDISFYYARANPAARKLAKEFEHENNLFLSKLFPNANYYQELIAEMDAQNTDESIVAKVADYTEVVTYKHHIGRLEPEDVPSNGGVLLKIVENANDEVVKKILIDFLSAWPQELPGKQALQIIMRG